MSWLYEGGGYHLFSNRDEKLSRSVAEPPRIFDADGVRYIAPRDGDFGGSWIAANEAGVSFCMLNGASAGGRERRKPAASESRGWVVIRLAGSATQTEALRSLRKMDLDRYAPFTLLTLEAGRRAAVTEWDGAELADHDGEPLLPLTSSSLNADAARWFRTALFRAEAPRTARAMAAYHWSHEPQRGALSPCMHREDAATVSFTHVLVSPGRVSMTYHDGSPCGPARRFTTEIHAPIPADCAFHAG